MKDNIPVLNTIEDLVAVALKSGDTRYKLNDNTVWEYDDIATGKAWEDGEDAYVGKHSSYGTPEYKAYRERVYEYEKLKPATHAVKTYVLRSDYDTRYSLGAELGAQVDGVWTKKVGRYSKTPERTGLLTLAGILKRMGRTDVATKIKDAETLRKEQDAKNRRNNIRRNVYKYLNDLEKYVKDYCAPIGVTPDMFQLPVELADALKEEE